jgi:sulfite exporter TauE/SafE
MNEPFSLALGLGFLLGLKHATEADHVVAVTTIISQERSIWHSALVGTVWGLGHTISLFIAGIFVIFLQVAIPQSIATILEFLVAIMIIFLGGHILYKLLRNTKEIHLHHHSQETISYSHVHFLDEAGKLSVTDDKAHSGKANSTNITNIGWRPLIVGMIHGLAGSAALTLLILTEVIKEGSQVFGLAYLLIFGIGSIGGMLLMSIIISLPFVFTSAKLEYFNLPIKILTSFGSIIFGVYYAWNILTQT